MSGDLPRWAMEQNLVLQAGAGTGKTHELVTLVLHLLSGANARRAPVPASRLVALTFTDKAGAEMRDRLQRRLAPLANGASLIAAGETELEGTFELLDLPRPSPDVWQRLRRDLSGASIGTFHSFCGLQLRRFAPLVGLDPEFEVLDEDEARTVFEDAAEDHILAALQAGDAGVRLLVDELGLSSRMPPGLTELTSKVLRRLEEEGRPARSLDDGRFSDGRAADQVVHAIDDMRDGAHSYVIPPDRSSGGFADLIRELQSTADRLKPDTILRDFERLTAMRVRLSKFPPFDTALEALGAAAAGLRCAPLGRAFVEVLDAVERRYTELKRAANAVDYADLQRLFRNLLRDDLSIRHELKSRIDALLVDEFQDTSRLQLDVVALLAESREAEVDLPSDDIAQEVRWQPGLLCVVGDRKQSIYGFRGADVAVFSTLQERLTRANPPARVEYLQQSYRSRPRLVSMVNALFRRAMPSGSLPFEVAFTGGDALAPKLDEEQPEPLVRLIEARGARANEHRPDEAKRLASYIDSVLNDPKEQLLVRDRNAAETVWRKAEGRDIVVLFRRLTSVNVYRAALFERGIPHVLVGGRDFYSTTEVLDAWALLRTLDDPSDPVSSAALLRSPFCTLGDDTIAKLSLVREGESFAARGVALERLLQLRPKVDDAREQARLDALLDFVGPMRRGLDHVGAAQALSLAMEELDYLSVVALQPDAESTAANLDKIRGILTRLEARHATAHGVVRTLTERIWNEYREPEAASSEESDPRCVRLMTIHQAKGLEFPIVLVPDCGAADPPENDRLAYDRDLGLGLSIRRENEEILAGPGLAAIRDRLNARKRAETLRLLYVALTRARDHLVVSGVPGKKDSWFELLAGLGEEHLKRIQVDPTAPHLMPPRAIPTGDSAIADWTAPPRLPIAELSTTVSALSELQRCPERYRLRHVIGLHERDEAPQPAVSVALARSQFATEAAQVPENQQIIDEPYSLRVDVDTGRWIFIQGRIGWAVLSAPEARLVQAPDAFALRTTALALRELLGALPIAGASLGDQEPRFESLSEAILDAHRRELVTLGRALLESHATDQWPRRERPFCDSISCGYRGRCFQR